MINDENVRVFNTPVKNGSAKMTWNSPFQSLQPANTATVTNGPSQNIKELLFDTVQDAYEDDLNFTGSIIDFSALNSENQLSNMNNSHHQQPRGNIPAFNTDIPVLDDLFSDLNSDLNSLDGVGKSEPVNFEDIERILLPQQPRKIRQPFSSILSTDSLPTGPFDQSPMLWDGSLEIPSQNHQNRNNSLIPLNPQTATANSKIQIKVIGKRPREPEPAISRNHRINNNNSSSSSYNTQSTQNSLTTLTHSNLSSQISLNPAHTVKVPYIPAPVNSRPAKSYRTYGKKRYAIGPEYADFVCRLQNDIPFDSSEDDDDEEAAEEDEQVRGSELGEDDSGSEGEDEEEEREAVKISAQELLELFEDSCSGLPGLISAFLTHRKHQIGLKGYKPRVNPSKTASAPPLLSQTQFDRIQNQLRLYFQFLIQNLALSNEIEGGEGVTLVSLKLLVQLHLHLDLVCNLRSSATSVNTTGISCLTLPTPRINPICSRLNELIPAGIKKVSIIAGFLVRPGQKQFLSLSALRADSTLKPKTVPSAPPLPLKIKNSCGNQLLSNAFYNILALFHDYIDAKLLDQTISATNLSKYLEMGSEVTTSTRTAKFLSSEDNLLLCGLHRFGCGNWESIQAQFLPFRTGRQLAIRYKNLSSRREPMNPIKEFNERLMMPLSEIEEDLLWKGVQRFGNQFHLISKHYLPHRPATVLGKLWKAMDDASRNK